MGRIAIVSSVDDYVAAVRGMAEQLGSQIVGFGSSNLPDITVGAIMAQRPDTVILGPGIQRGQVMTLTSELDVNHPDVVVVWIAEETPETWRDAVQSGARIIVSPTATNTDFVTHITEATAIAERRRNQHLAGATEDAAGEGLGRIVVVVSPKGGSGKTMLSANIAAGLAADTQKSERGVVLVDLDLQFGDVASALGLRPEYSIIDVLNASGDATATKAFLTPYMPNLFALPAPNNPAEAEDVDPEQLAKLLVMLRSEFSHVIVDTGAGMDESILTAVEQATDVVFVCTVDVAGIQALRKVVIVLDQLQLNQSRRWFVLNRADSRTGLSPSEIEEVLGLAIDVHVPSHRAISKSLNQGVPVVVDQRRSKVGKSLLAASDLLVASPKRKAKGRGR